MLIITENIFHLKQINKVVKIKAKMRVQIIAHHQKSHPDVWLCQ